MPVRALKVDGIPFVLDVRPDRLDLRDRMFQPATVSLPMEFPDQATFRSHLPNYVNSGLVLDQGREGACTGFGLAAVVNYLLWLRAVAIGDGASFRAVSPYMLYDLARFYDEWPGQSYEGSSCRGAMKGWHKHGVCESPLWPRSIYPTQSSGGIRRGRAGAPSPRWAADAMHRPVGVYYRVDRRSVTDLQAAIREVGAVYASCTVHGGWQKPVFGSSAARFSKRSATQYLSNVSHSGLPAISYAPGVELSGGHAFALVGYNRDGFIVQNSWGTSWGLCGFAVLRYDDWVENGLDAWVCALGVPQTRHGSGSSIGQQSSVTRRAANASLLSGDIRTSAKPNNPLATPWETERAYLHSVVAGNDGIVDVQRPDMATAAAMVDSVAYESVRNWFHGEGSTKPKKIVIFAHGGLNSEPESIQRARVLGPYFKANGIYPLFYVWKTGIGETLCNELTDRFSAQNQQAVAAGKLGDVRDRFIESVAHGPLRWAWRQMKENAERGMLAGHAIALLARSLSRLSTLYPDAEVHLVGHSAGAFVVGHLLRSFRKANVGVASTTLYAPACSLRFALDHFANGDVSKNRFWMHLLSDRNEQDDFVVSNLIYGKSLLYLVDRGFEEVRKTPLAGLAKTLDTASVDRDDDLWTSRFYDDVVAWRGWVHALPAQADARAACEIVTTPSISTGYTPIAAAHGSFDNNVEVMTRTINRILGASPGAALPVPVEDLNF
jgi:hypothetical protein